ncbi:hypothetical protein BDV23DRAFT_190351 [Aspergillus alliaceus]|uniref:HNH nuclease domain-containing protein n=1 Tax=Petromyces alliaceus TaxID=209559 RepID=A0A5N7BW11_PETAA|nr:hypothetical protein BDV23DRAFT_190351 [Aspergillus alliaceus]
MDSLLMPPPPPPKLQGSSPEKRKMSSSASEGNSSGAFSEPSRTEIKRWYKWLCFACECSVSPDAVHVIQTHDTATAHLTERKLIDFNLKGIQNGVTLCPNCHRMFDCDIDPGFVFFPSDLEFFIQKELEYRQRWQSPHTSGRVPSAAEYCQHQIRNGTIPPGSQAGLYKRVFLRNYLSPAVSSSANEMFSQPVPWYGAPFGALRRALHILGSPRIAVISPDIRNQLNRLRDLYYTFDLITERLLVSAQVNDPEYGPGPRSYPDQSETDPSLTRNIDPGNSTISPDQCSKPQPPDHQAPSSAHEGFAWILGPESTSEDAMRRYGPAIQYPSTSPPRVA